MIKALLQARSPPAPALPPAPQVLIYQSLGFPTPVFGHVSLILAPDKSKLSKRHGATSVGEFREDGYLAQVRQLGCVCRDSLPLVCAWQEALARWQLSEHAGTAGCKRNPCEQGCMVQVYTACTAHAGQSGLFSSPLRQFAWWDHSNLLNLLLPPAAGHAQLPVAAGLERRQRAGDLQRGGAAEGLLAGAHHQERGGCGPRG